MKGATRFPEQERALAYARRRGTEATLAEIRSRVAQTFADFESLVAAIPPELALQRPAPATWSVQEIVDHLVVSDAMGAKQLAQLLAGEDSTEAIPAGLQSPSPLELSWPVLIADFRRVHEQLLSLLDGASDDVPLAASAAVEMVVKCATTDGEVRPVHWSHSFDWKAFAILLHAHNREHIAQTQRVLAALATPPVAPLSWRAP